MLQDIATVMWKELKELVMQRGSFRGGITGMLIFVGVFGIVLPLEMGRGWIESPATLVYWAWVPLFVGVSIVADAFAGERERHTLETLLASRLPDRAILLGKIASAMTYSLSITLASVVLGVITINLANLAEAPILYAPAVALGIVGFAILGAGLSATAGALVSLRAGSVRQAQQTLSIGVLLLFVLPVFGSQLLPAATRESALALVTRQDVTALAAAGLGLMLALNLALLGLAMARFRRALLILD